VERGVKHGHEGHVGQQGLGLHYANQIGRVVQRGQRGAGVELFNHLRRHYGRFHKNIGPMHGAMPHRLYVLDGADSPVFRVQQSLNHQLKAFAVSGNIRLKGKLLVTGLMLEGGTAFPNSRYRPFGRHRFQIGAVQLVLNGRTAAIYYQNHNLFASSALTPPLA
jgi:hypothetical protein